MPANIGADTEVPPIKRGVGLLEASVRERAAGFQIVHAAGIARAAPVPTHWACKRCSRESSASQPEKHPGESRVGLPGNRNRLPCGLPKPDTQCELSTLCSEPVTWSATRRRNADVSCDVRREIGNPAIWVSLGNLNESVVIIPGLFREAGHCCAEPPSVPLARTPR